MCQACSNHSAFALAVSSNLPPTHCQVSPCPVMTFSRWLDLPRPKQNTPSPSPNLSSSPFPTLHPHLGTLSSSNKDRNFSLFCSQMYPCSLEGSLADKYSMNTCINLERDHLMYVPQSPQITLLDRCILGIFISSKWKRCTVIFMDLSRTSTSAQQIKVFIWPVLMPNIKMPFSRKMLRNSAWDLGYFLPKISE